MADNTITVVIYGRDGDILVTYRDVTAVTVVDDRLSILMGDDVFAGVHHGAWTRYEKFVGDPPDDDRAKRWNYIIHPAKVDTAFDAAMQNRDRQRARALGRNR